jgi:hypothetical protein
MNAATFVGNGGRRGAGSYPNWLQRALDLTFATLDLL